MNAPQQILATKLFLPPQQPLRWSNDRGCLTASQRIVHLLADLRTVLPTRKRPATSTQTFGGTPANVQREDMGITPEDSASVLFDTDGRARGVFTVSQVGAGHKNRLSLEVNGSQASARWDGDAPNDLWTLDTTKLMTRVMGTHGLQHIRSSKMVMHFFCVSYNWDSDAMKAQKARQRDERLHDLRDRQRHAQGV